MKNDTICRTCLRLRQGICDGEKELTACPSYKRMTNGDRIRAMTEEELAKLLCDFIGCCECPYLRKPEECNGERIGWLDWLKQEVSE